MPNYALMNPGKYHLGTPFSFPPIQNRTFKDKYYIQEIKWKTSVLLNRRIYVGNVEIKDRDGKVRILSDSIFKSKSNKFDTFTTDRRIDVAVGDGEEIIRLVAYADRLLQFKQNTLHIINAQKDVEILESVHKYKGVSNHNAVCETDYGIAWCNTHGVYMYNGQQVSELFVRQGLRTISEETWNSFYKEGETMIGYVPKSKQLLVFRGITGNDSKDIMIFDMVTSSWTKGTGRLGNQDKTNLVNIWNGKLVYGYENADNKITVVPWKSICSVDIDNFKVQTKQMNFGTEAKKKINKVRITYKGTNPTNVLPKYSVNGGAFNNSFKDENGTAITNIAGTSNSGADWSEIELYTDTSIAGSIRSLAIELTDVSGANVQSNFEINDITIIFRTKSVK